MKVRSTKVKLFYEWYQQNKEKVKDVSSRNIHRLFDKDHPGVYTLGATKELALRIIRGQINDDSFDVFLKVDTNPVTNIEDLSDIEPNFNTSFFDSNMVDLPTSWAESYVPYVIEGCKNLGVCSDIHLPYHDELALSAVFSEFKKRKVDGIYLNGDVMDYEKISRFGSMPDGRYLKDEIEVGLAFLKALRRMFPSIPIYWKDGNHEKRLTTYIIQKAPELANAYGLDTPSMLKFDEFGIIYVPENIVSRFGKLWIAHGHELGMGGGSVNIARQVRLRVGVSILVGHWHKQQFDQSRNLADETHAAWALGCLCYLKPRYTGALNQWSQGAATVELLNEKGEFRVNTFQILNGRVN